MKYVIGMSVLLLIVMGGCVENQSHFECINQTCSEVPGIGQNQCQTDADCQATCQNTCSQEGLKQCVDNSYQVCGNYDSDSCLEWSSSTTCSDGTECQNGVCEIASAPQCNVDLIDMAAYFRIDRWATEENIEDMAKQVDNFVFEPKTIGEYISVDL